MKYTKEQALKLKNKGMGKYSSANRYYPETKIIDGFYVIESKMNKNNS